jgi:hypothetical protein
MERFLAAPGVSPLYEERLASYEQDGNRVLFEALDRQLELASPTL